MLAVFVHFSCLGLDDSMFCFVPRDLITLKRQSGLPFPQGNFQKPTVLYPFIPNRKISLLIALAQLVFFLIAFVASTATGTWLAMHLLHTWFDAIFFFAIILFHVTSVLQKGESWLDFSIMTSVTAFKEEFWVPNYKPNLELCFVSPGFPFSSKVP